MITFKIPARFAIIIVAAIAVIVTLNVYGAFPGGNGALQSVVTSELPFAKPADPATPLRVAIYPGGGFAAGLLSNGGLRTAKDSIYEKEFKLNVEFILVEDPARCMRLLGKEGGADIVWSTVPMLTQRYGRNCRLNPVAIMQFDYSRGENALYGLQNYTRLDDLKGKTAACVEGGDSHFLLLFLLGAGGITPDNLKWKFTTTDSDAALLVRKGRADLCGVSTAGISVPATFKLLFSSAHAARLIPGVFITREDMLIRKRDQINKFTLGWFRGAAELPKNRDSIIKLMAGAYGCDEKKAEDLLKEALQTGYLENCAFFRIGQGTLPGFDHLVDLAASVWNHAAGSGRPSCASLKNTDTLVSIGQEIKKSVGGYDAGLPEFVKNPAISLFSKEFSMEFPAADYSVEFRTSMALERFAKIAGLFDGSTVLLHGRTSAPEDLAYSYNWGMRFYIVGKMLTDLGIPKDRIIVKDIKYDPALSGGQKHHVSCVISR